MKYLLGTGFYGGQQEQNFHDVWSLCLTRNCSQKPDKVVILSVGGIGSQFGLFSILQKAGWPQPQEIILSGNPGHVGQLMSGDKPGPLCGWSATLLWLCVTAYANESDLCFCEQDVLAFGDWFGKMMEELGDGKFIWGKKMQTAPFMHGANSIVYIRHDFLLTFVQEYIACGNEADPDRVPETKFRMIEMKYPHESRRMSFNFDRERPINFDEPVWAAQKIIPEEMAEIYRRGLL